MLSKAALQNLGDELTRLCDGLEKSGLVDYEMGVWEEEIILCKMLRLEKYGVPANRLKVLLQCKELNSTGNEDPGSAGLPRRLIPDSGNRQRHF